MSEMIKGLTLRHPWAWAFSQGKDVENRTWHPSRQGGKVGMYLALHGGNRPKKSDHGYHDEIAHALEWMEDLNLTPSITLPDFGHYYQPNMMRGVSPSATAENTAQFCPTGIVAVGHLTGVVQDSVSLWAQDGQYHWEMTVTPLPEPIPHRGAQGLWEIEPGALAQVRTAYRLTRTENMAGQK